MIITIHQPEHLPWLGLFNKMAKAEKYVVLDSVQYERIIFRTVTGSWGLMVYNGSPSL